MHSYKVQIRISWFLSVALSLLDSIKLSLIISARLTQVCVSDSLFNKKFRKRILVRFLPLSTVLTKISIGCLKKLFDV